MTRRFPIPTFDALPMNEHKHTPGPWQAVKFDDEHDAVIIGPNGDERIAVLAGNEGNEPDCPNAHLIAAAPELLGALEELERECATYLRGSPFLDNTRAAIAKAKGEIK